jgi:polysaccharide export outer membrane protein
VKVIASIMALTILLTLGGCASAPHNLPHGAAAYESFPAPSANEPQADYRINPLDVLSVNVFREPDLTMKDIQVDASGNLLFPLIGSLQAAGKTSAELSGEIAARLGERYLRNPQVTVAVSSSVSQRVVVEGNVTDPGVYEIGGNTTLLEALARAKSPTRVAALDRVVIFRVIDGQRYGAVFDVSQIRSGLAPDPQIRGGDTVVVGFSAIKGAFRDFLTSAPLLLSSLNTFRNF